MNRSVFAPNRWRAIAAVLIGLAVCLPLYSCEGTSGHPKAYIYPLDAARAEFSFCTRPEPSESVLGCYSNALQTAAVVVLTFTWPLLTLVLALRVRRRWVTAARLIAEPPLVVFSAQVLDPLTFVFADPEAGSYALGLGLLVYGGAWVNEIGRLAVRAVRSWRSR